jgi:hypothetical protein
MAKKLSKETVIIEVQLAKTTTKDLLKMLKRRVS